MAPQNTIPDGFELHAGRGRDFAKAAIDLAVERGFEGSSVLVRPEGYLVPVGDDDAGQAPGEGLVPSDPGAGDPGASDDESGKAIIEEVTIPKTKDGLIEFAKTHDIDLGDATNNEQRTAAIEAEIERRTKLAEETGTLTPAGGDTPAGDDQQAGSEPADESKED